MTAKQLDKEVVLANAKAIAQKYLDCFNTTGKYDLNEIAKALSTRTHDGKPVEIVVVASPAEAAEVIRKKAKEEGVDLATLNAWSCIWDYYLMAFYDAAYSQCPDQSIEFGRQSFFDAFKAGLGFYINLGNFAVAIARPEAHRDPQLRLHKESGPAIVWGNTKQYWWHGVQVEEDWIMNKSSVDVKLALTHPNIEQRRALCEILGWVNVLKQLNCKTVHKDEFGELLETTLPDAQGPTRFVKVQCATDRTFCLPVPSTVKTAHEAVALTYGLKTDEYQPEVRT